MAFKGNFIGKWSLDIVKSSVQINIQGMRTLRSSPIRRQHPSPGTSSRAFTIAFTIYFPFTPFLHGTWKNSPNFRMLPGQRDDLAGLCMQGCFKGRIEENFSFRISIQVHVKLFVLKCWKPREYQIELKTRVFTFFPLLLYVLGEGGWWQWGESKSQCLLLPCLSFRCFHMGWFCLSSATATDKRALKPLS